MRQIKAHDYETWEIIRFIREWTELTQRDFGNSINRAAKTIADYECGRCNVNLKLFLEMCKVHGIEVIIRKQ